MMENMNFSISARIRRSGSAYSVFSNYLHVFIVLNATKILHSDKVFEIVVSQASVLLAGILLIRRLAAHRVAPVVAAMG